MNIMRMKGRAKMNELASEKIYGIVFVEEV